MTDDERMALIARLRDGRWKGETTCGPAADQMEADGKRIAELEAALRYMALSSGCFDACLCWLSMRAKAREALGDRP